VANDDEDPIVVGSLAQEAHEPRHERT
jgi:hypothetical protein